jgi:murein DD-endopeptidase MepM/ murein hydrolase activator NlpD
MTNETIINFAIAALILGAMWGASQIAPVEQAQAAPVQQAQPAALAPAGRKHPVTDTLEVSANFYSTGSGYWAGQAGGMHLGTDMAGQPGDNVYAPFDLTFEMTGYYSDPGRLGHYLIGRFADGTLFYSGHLADVIQAAPGEIIPVGTVIGHIGDLYHTHIKLEPPGSPSPCEGPGTCIDFEEYFNTH